MAGYPNHQHYPPPPPPPPPGGGGGAFQHAPPPPPPGSQQQPLPPGQQQQQQQQAPAPPFHSTAAAPAPPQMMQSLSPPGPPGGNSGFGGPVAATAAGGGGGGGFAPPPPPPPPGGGGFGGVTRQLSHVRGAPPPPPAAAPTATASAIPNRELTGGIRGQMENLSVSGGSGPPPPPAQPPVGGVQMFTPKSPGAGGGGPPPMMQQQPPPPPPPPGGVAAAATPGFGPPGSSPPPQQQPTGASPGAFYPAQPNQPPMNPGGAPQQQQQQQQQQGGQIFQEKVDFSIKIPKRLFRLTSEKIAQTPTLAASTKIPMGAVLRPLAPVGPYDEEVDVVQPGAAGIIRCKRCRTYINSFVSWLENGRRWRCNICGQLNDCPSAYFCHLDPQTSQRRDRLQRPELCKGVVEFVAPSEYMVRPPQPPSYFFVLDVSVSAVRSGMLGCAARAIRDSLDSLPGGKRTQIGFITFDNSVQYYNLKAGLSNPQMMVVADLKELFVPAPDDLLVNLNDSRDVVDSFLDNLPTMFSKNQVPFSCLGPALKAAFTVTKHIGGKMCVFQSVLPTLGDGALKPRENVRFMGTPEEVKLLRPENNWYKETAVEFSRAQISVDMFLFPYQYIDCAALSELPKLTAGTLNTYVAFQPQRDGPKFESELRKVLQRTTAFEAVMRIRCTKGMRISNFYGNFFIRGTDLLALPNCTSNSVFAFDIVHDEQSVNSSVVTVQSALLYTSSDGERRIRVLTQALPVTSLASELIASVDTDAMCNLLAKQALGVSIKSNLDNARARLQQTCVDIVRCAKSGDKRTVSGYTVGGGGEEDEKKPIPDNLKLLPLYTLALLKNVAFRGGTDVHPDERVQAHMMLNGMWVTDSRYFIYPRMFSIHDMTDDVGLPKEDVSNQAEDEDDDNDDGEEAKTSTAGGNNIFLPRVVNLSVDRLNSDGIFLLDNRHDMYIWVGRTSDPTLTNELFGMSSLENADMAQLKLLSSGDTASRLNTVINSLCEDPSDPLSISPKITIVREGDAAIESRFFWHLVEDRASFNGGTYNYLEFMQFVNQPPRAAPGAAMPPGAPPGMTGAPMRGGPPGMAPPPPPPGAPGAPPPPPPGGMVGRGPPPPPPAGLSGGPPPPPPGGVPPPPGGIPPLGGPPPPPGGPPRGPPPPGGPPPPAGPPPPRAPPPGGPPPPAGPPPSGVPPPPMNAGPPSNTQTRQAPPYANSGMPPTNYSNMGPPNGNGIPPMSNPNSGSMPPPPPKMGGGMPPPPPPSQYRY